MLVAIGDNCIDRYLPPIALERVGGNAVNVAATLATHGMAAAYAGVVGDDESGASVIAALRSVGVNVECVMRASGPTGLTEIRVEGGDYAIVLEEYGVSDQLRITDTLLGFLSRHATRIHLTVTGHATTLIADLHSTSLPISIDLGIVRDANDLGAFESTLPFFSEVFFSAGGDAQDESVDDALRKAVQLGSRAAIATRGERGCTALIDGERLSMPSHITAEEIVDPLGAGDAFIAGYLSNFGHGPWGEPRSATHRLHTASAWAAEACKRIGGWPGAEA